MPATSRRRSARSAAGLAAAGPTRRRARLPAFAVVVLVLAAVSAGVGRVHLADAADPAREVTAARAAADRAAERYFAVQGELQRLDRSIAAADAAIADAARRAAATRAVAAERAAVLYRSSSVAASAPATATSSLVLARSAQLLDSANQSAQHDIDRFSTAMDDLHRERARLAAARTRERHTLQQLARQRTDLDARLAVVERAYQAELAARRAAAAAAATSTTARRASPSTGRAGSLPAASSAPATTSTTLPAPPPPPPPPPGQNPHHDDPFLTCVRQRESSGDYGAVNPSGYYGAYQFSTSTWDGTASHAGRLDLIGVRPDHASAWDQDQLAWDLYQWQGMVPWGGGCP
jgi:hypothetical protein